jgi:large subunit ribosomal protein L29
MPILRIKEIRKMSSEDRGKRLSELQTELVRLKTMIKAGGAIENPARVSELRKTIARILTVENEQPSSTREERSKLGRNRKGRKRKI